VPKAPGSLIRGQASQSEEKQKQDHRIDRKGIGKDRISLAIQVS